MANEKIVVDIELNDSKYKKGLGNAEKQTEKFGKTAKNSFTGVGKSLNGMKASYKDIATAAVGAYVAMAGVRKVITSLSNINKEMFLIGKEALGVEKAFNRIEGSNLKELRDSVKGTVSDLELMKNAVSGTKLGLDIKSMGELFAFAKQTAKETGQEVDHLVESITVGIGRKSPLILDNLGISAIQLKEKLNGVSIQAASVADVSAAVAQIAREAMEGTGASAIDAADAYEILQSTIENTKAEGGALLINNKEIKNTIQEITKLINENKGPILQFITEWGVGATKLVKTFTQLAAGVSTVFTTQKKSARFLAVEELGKRLDALKEQKKYVDDLGKSALGNANIELAKAKEKQAELKKSFDEQAERVKYLAKIDTLAAEQKKKKDDAELERVKKINAEKAKGALIGTGKEPTSDAMTAGELAGVSPYLAEKQERDNAIADITNKQRSLLEQKEADRIAVLSAMYSNIETERQLAQEKAIEEKKIRDLEKKRIEDQRREMLQLTTNAINSITSIVGIMANESLNVFGKFSSSVGAIGGLIPEFGPLIQAGAGLATSLFGQADEADSPTTAVSEASGINRLSSTINKPSTVKNFYISVTNNAQVMGGNENDMNDFAQEMGNRLHELALSAG